MKRAGWRSSISLPDESGSIAKMGWRVVAKSGSEALLYRSEEHTSELQSHSDLVCRLLLEKKKPTKLQRKLRTRGIPVALIEKGFTPRRATRLLDRLTHPSHCPRATTDSPAGTLRTRYRRS